MENPDEMLDILFETKNTDAIVDYWNEYCLKSKLEYKYIYRNNYAGFKELFGRYGHTNYDFMIGTTKISATDLLLPYFYLESESSFRLLFTEDPRRIKDTTNAVEAQITGSADFDKLPDYVDFDALALYLYTNYSDQLISTRFDIDIMDTSTVARKLESLDDEDLARFWNTRCCDIDSDCRWDRVYANNISGYTDFMLCYGADVFSEAFCKIEDKERFKEAPYFYCVEDGPLVPVLVLKDYKPFDIVGELAVHLREKFSPKELRKMLDKDTD